MVVQFYNTNDKENVINKTLVDQQEVQVISTTGIDIMNPHLYIHHSGEFNFNYAYIPDYRRYYFIDSIFNRPNGIKDVGLRIDVLESWKEDILNGEGEIVRQEHYNPYYPQGFQVDGRKEVEVYYSDKELTGKSLVLTTLGVN